jgi:MFS superfamily sulfate permease-like transporter
MAYALLAGLSPEYGLYTSFTGAVLYWLFGTSKDIVVGVRNKNILDSKLAHGTNTITFSLRQPLLDLFWLAQL